MNTISNIDSVISNAISANNKLSGITANEKREFDAIEKSKLNQVKIDQELVKLNSLGVKNKKEQFKYEQLLLNLSNKRLTTTNILKDAGVEQLNFAKKSVFSFKNVDDILSNIDKSIAGSNKNIERMDFGFLSLIFGGQALQRVFGGFFKSVVDGYNKLGDKNDTLTKTTSRVSNAFQWLKFTLGQAFSKLLDTPVISSIINTFIDALNGLGNFITDHPWLSGSLITLAGALTVLGIAMETIGQMVTLNMAADALVKMAGTEPAISKIGNSFKNWITNLSPVSIIIGLLIVSIALWIVLFYKTMNMFPTFKKYGLDVFNSIKESVMLLISTFVDLLSTLFDVNLDVGDLTEVFRFLGAIGSYVFAIINLGIQTAILSLYSLFNLGKAFILLMRGDFIEAGKAAKDAFTIPDSVMNGYSTSVDIIKKGISGLYDESKKYDDSLLEGSTNLLTEQSISPEYQNQLLSSFDLITGKSLISTDEISNNLQSITTNGLVPLDTALTNTTTNSLDPLLTKLSDSTPQETFLANTEEFTITALTTEADNVDELIDKYEKLIETKKRASSISSNSSNTSVFSRGITTLT